MRQLALLAIALCACAPSRPAATSLRAEFVDGIIILEATLDGKQGWWLLDSGYEYSLIDEQAAQGSSLTIGAADSVDEPGGKVYQAWARGAALDLNGIAFKPDSIAVIPFAQLSPVVGRNLTGLLGHDFFQHNVVIIDYAARTVRLVSPDRWTPPATATGLKVWIEAGEPFVGATLWAAGRTVPAKLKLDTGSLSGLGLNGSFVAQNRLFPSDWPRRPVEGIAVGGATRNFIGRLDSMSLGGFIIPSPVVGWSEDLTRVGDAGTIGAPNLARFRVTFDYARQRLFLEPYPNAFEPETFSGTGLLVVQVPDQAFIIAQVIPATPADSAGLATGDVITRIDGVDPASVGLDSVRAWLRHPGTELSLDVTREGKPLSTVVKQTELP